MVGPAPSYTTSIQMDHSDDFDESHLAASGQLLPSSQDIQSLGASFTPTYGPSPLSYTSNAVRTKPSNHFNGSSQFSLDLDLSEGSEGFEGRQKERSYRLDSYINTPHESKVPPNQPWNLVNPPDLSMNSQFNHQTSTVQQKFDGSIADSGYVSRPKADHNFSPNSAVQIPVDAVRDFPCDEELGGATAQSHYLPDFQPSRQLDTNINPITSVPQSPYRVPSTAKEVVSTSSTNPFLHCEDCSEKFSTKSELGKHMARHKKDHRCDVRGCPKSLPGAGFATTNDLARHRKSVHPDKSAPRDVYLCCVAGCKDPSKEWDRKDNFKAHVKRMHPAENPEEIVKRSFHYYGVQEKSQDSDTPVDHELTPRDRSQSTVTPQNLGLNLNRPQHPYNSHDLSRHFFELGQGGPDVDLFEEGNMYAGLSTTDLNPAFGQPDTFTSLSNNPESPGSAHPHTISHLANETMRQNQYPSLVPDLRSSRLTGMRSSFPSSQTSASQEMTRENTAPGILSYRSDVGLDLPSNYGYSNTFNRRPFDSQTAPGRPTTDDVYFENSPHVVAQTETFSISDPNLPNIDPSLYLGGWALNHPTNLPDPATQADLPTGDAPAATTQAIKEGRDEALRKLTAIFKCYSEEALHAMVEQYQSHPHIPNIEKCALNSTIDNASSQKSETRPFKCSREGCMKTFTQRNIRTKHEKRHDKSFFCTFDGCYSTFGSKDDLRRHEKRKHQPEAFHGWRCFTDDVPTSQHKLDCSKFFEDEKEFKNHRREEHKERAQSNNRELRALRNCNVQQGHDGPFWCGFCDKVIRNEPNNTNGTKRDKFRYDHIDRHIAKEKKKMADWIDLKSEGLTKEKVKDRSLGTADGANAEDLNDNNETDCDDDEDELEGPSPCVSTTLPDTVPRTPAYHSQYLTAPSTLGYGRKRAFSDLDGSARSHPIKLPRSDHFQPSFQTIPPYRGPSDVAFAGQEHMDVMSHRHTPAVMLQIQCCRCGRRRAIEGSPTCEFDCMHGPCHQCPVLDVSGHRVHFKNGKWTASGSGA